MANRIVILAAGTEDSHDLCLDENGQIMTVEGIDAYSQIVNCEMRTILGEKRLDVNSGLPYLQTVFRDRDLVPFWTNAAKTAIERLPFVIEVVSIKTKLEDGVFSYKSVIRTDLGPLTHTGSVKLNTIRDKTLRDPEDITEIKSYILTFYCGPDTNISPMVCRPGDIVRLPVPALSGYTFVGWYMDSEFKNRINTFVMPDENTTIYARFESFTKFEINVDELVNNDEDFILRIWRHEGDNSKVLIDWGDGWRNEYECNTSSSDRETTNNNATIVRHRYTKNGFGNISVGVGQNCFKFKIGENDVANYSDHDSHIEASHRAVRKLYKWSESLVNAFRTFSFCRNLSGDIPEWPTGMRICDGTFEDTDISSIVEWPSEVVNMKYCFANCRNLKGTIPVIPKVVDSAGDVILTLAISTFQNCEHISPTPMLEGESEEDYSNRIMPNHADPTRVTNYVLGCSQEVRGLYTLNWGGTKN